MIWLKKQSYFKNISQEFTLKNIDETRNYFLEETKQNELTSKKHKNVCATLHYIEHFLYSLFQFPLLLLWLFFV